MKSLKTYEGFFDFFKSQPSEDDKIALEYIIRLKKVKGISPYKITYDPGNREGGNFEIDKWIVDFEDTPIKLWSVISLRSNGFDEQSQELLLSKKLARYSKKEFYGLNIICEGEPENCKAKPDIIKELVELVKSVYDNDKEARRIEKIKININKAADLIEDEPVEESVDVSDFKSDLIDICIELEDIGLRVEVSGENNNILIYIKDFSKGYLSPLNIKSIEDTIYRILDFATQQSYTTSIITHAKHHSQRTIEVKFKEGVLLDKYNKLIDYRPHWLEIIFRK